MLEGCLAWLSERRAALGLAASSAVMWILVAPGFGQAYLAWIALVPFFWLLGDDRLRRRDVAVLSLLFGVLAHVDHDWWAVAMVEETSELPCGLALLGFMAVLAVRGSTWAIWGLLVHKLSVRGSVPLAASAPALAVGAEWLLSGLVPSFLATSQFRHPVLLQALDLLGPLWITFLLVHSSAVVFVLLRWAVAIRSTPTVRFPLGSSLALGVLMGLNGAYAVAAMASVNDRVRHADDPVAVGLVQANLAGSETTAVKRLRRLRQQSLELAAQGADLIVWPEASYVLPLPTGARQLKEAVMGSVQLGRPLVFGGQRMTLPRPDGVTTRGHDLLVYNTAFFMDETGALKGSFDTPHYQALLAHGHLGRALGGLWGAWLGGARLSRGASCDPVSLDRIRYGVLMNHEDALPWQVRKRMVGVPQVLLSLSDDKGLAKRRQRLHLATAVLRAIEQRRFLARATPTGLSAIIDPTGRIVAQAPAAARANVLGEVAPLEGLTLYAQTGDLLGPACLIALLAWLRRDVSRLLRRAVAPLMNRSG